MYQRLLKSQILDKLFLGRAIIIVGARRVGKTTLANEIIDSFSLEKSLIKFNGDDPGDRDRLNNKDIGHLREMIGSRKLIFIDEAQKIPTIGQTVKLLVDEFGKEKQVILTGSSSINLLNKTSEPLTGRKWVFHLYPLSLEEMYAEDDLALDKKLSSHLIFGNYPNVVAAQGQVDKEDVLRELSSSYLYKDIFEFQEVRNSSVIRSLLKALSLQIGSEASYNELSNILGIDQKTVERYVNLLEKNFVIFRLEPYARNIRRAISKQRKIFFYDLGVRNSVINNFNALEDRNDVGAMWENFVIAERIKFQSYHKLNISNYFFRTYDGAEIDLVEERGGQAEGYEFKWGKKITKPKRDIAKVKIKLINPGSLKGFVL